MNIERAKTPDAGPDVVCEIRIRVDAGLNVEVRSAVPPGVNARALLSLALREAEAKLMRKAEQTGNKPDGPAVPVGATAGVILG